MVNSFYTPINTENEKETKVDPLIAKIKEMDNEQWFYNKEPAGGLTDNEKALAKLMEIERAKYISEVGNGENIAAQPFYDIKEDRIKSEPLFNVFKKMPKGGLLHVHSSAALSIEGYRDLLEKWDLGHASHPKTGEPAPLSIFVLKEDYTIEGKDPILAGSLYYKYCKEKLNIPDTKWAPICDYLTDVKKWNDLCALLTFNHKTAFDKDHWKTLNLMFIRIDNLFTDKDFFTGYHESFFKECREDGIEYVEMRCGFTTFGSPDKPVGLPVLHEDYSHKNYHVCREMMSPDNEEPAFLKCIKTAVTNVNKGLKDTDKIIVKVILNVRRDLDPKVPAQNNKIINRLEAAIEYHLGDYKDLVIGFDFVSEEDKGQRTSVYSKEYIYKTIGSQSSPSISLIDFYLHDGESLWTNNNNIYDAVAACKYRIGHGFNMALHPGIINNITFTRTTPEKVEYSSIIQAKFPILELCPISNQLLGYFPDLRGHTGYQLMRNGIMCVLGNDDPFMFGNPGLSYDFWMAYVCMGLDFYSVKRLVFNSLLPMHGYNDENNFPSVNFLSKWEDFVNESLKKLKDPPPDEE